MKFEQLFLAAQQKQSLQEYIYKQRRNGVSIRDSDGIVFTYLHRKGNQSSLRLKFRDSITAPLASRPDLFKIHPIHTDAIKTALAQGALPCEADRHGKAPLMLAIELDGPLETINALVNSMHSVDQLTPDKETALYMAFRRKNYGAAEIILKHGASITIVDRFDCRLCAYVVLFLRDMKALKLMFENGARVEDFCAKQGNFLIRLIEVYIPQAP